MIVLALILAGWITMRLALSAGGDASHEAPSASVAPPRADATVAAGEGAAVQPATRRSASPVSSAASDTGAGAGAEAGTGAQAETSPGNPPRPVPLPPREARPVPVNTASGHLDLWLAAVEPAGQIASDRNVADPPAAVPASGAAGPIPSGF